MEDGWAEELHVGVISVQIIEIDQKMIPYKIFTATCEIPGTCEL